MAGSGPKAEGFGQGASDALVAKPEGRGPKRLSAFAARQVVVAVLAGAPVLAAATATLLVCGELRAAALGPVDAFVERTGLLARRCHGCTTKAKQIVNNMKQALVHFAMDNKEPCPKDLKELRTQKLIDKDPKDPWGEELIYRCPGEHDTDSADVTSKGPDRKEGTEDDIKSWEL